MEPTDQMKAEAAKLQRQEFPQIIRDAVFQNHTGYIEIQMSTGVALQLAQDLDLVLRAEALEAEEAERDGED